MAHSLFSKLVSMIALLAALILTQPLAAAPVANAFTATSPPPANDAELVGSQSTFVPPQEPPGAGIPAPDITFQTLHDDQAIRANNGSLTAVAELHPAQQHHAYQYQLFIDDKPATEKQSSPVFHLHNLDRGDHHLQLILFSDHGDALSSSKIITIHLLRHHI